MLPALALAAALAAPAPCPGRTTPEVEACLRADLEAADADLTRYLATARGRIQAGEDEGADKVLAAFDASQTAWEAYREAECGAVYLNWSGGTIRGAASLACQVRLTRSRAWAVWDQWLTYADSSPPVLPEPDRPRSGR